MNVQIVHPDVYQCIQACNKLRLWPDYSTEILNQYNISFKMPITLIITQCCTTQKVHLLRLWLLLSIFTYYAQCLYQSLLPVQLCIDRKSERQVHTSCLSKCIREKRLVHSNRTVIWIIVQFNCFTNLTNWYIFWWY